MTRTAFLDRDGTINVKAPEGQYVTGPEQLTLLPRAAEAIHRLNEAGFRVVVVTNQRGVSLGAMSAEDVDAVHARLAEQLAERGARIDAYFVCPHDERSCDCRKPGIGMFLRARAQDPAVELEDA